MARYEFSEGTSNKFWEITLEGTSFTTRYGKIGTDGQSTTKSFASEALAKKEHDKLVAEKTKKGYTLAGGAAAPAPAPAKAPAATAPAAATPVAAPAEAAPEGEVRYEFQEGTSSKFWAITLAGTSLTTRFGKIGTDGQSSTKTFGSPADARKEHDKLVAEKTKKGYQLAGAAAPAGAAAVAPRPLVGLEREVHPSEHPKAFVHRTILAYKPKRGLTQAAKGVAYRVAIKDEYGESDDDDDDDASDIEAILAKLVADKNADKLQALVVGSWSDPGDMASSQTVIDALVAAAGKLPELRALFLGDIVQEESEISWIEQGDFAPLVAAFPKLEHLRVRGPKTMGKLASDTLRSLALETGGLDRGIVQSLSGSRLPALEHLELWLGTDEYGGNTEIDDLVPLLSGKLFPKLRYLGLRDSDESDAVAAAVASSPVIGRIATLDLSLGTLGDAGAEALLASPGVAKLQRLDIHHHYVSEALVKKLKGLGIDLAAHDRQDADEHDGESERYVSVGE
jgi:predicted DNA-binding WGR domain protein